MSRQYEESYTKWSENLFLEDQITATKKGIEMLQAETEKLRSIRGIGQLFVTQRMEAKIKQIKIYEKHLKDLTARRDTHLQKKLRNKLTRKEMTDLLFKKARA